MKCVLTISGVALLMLACSAQTMTNAHRVASAERGSSNKAVPVDASVVVEGPGQTPKTNSSQKPVEYCGWTFRQPKKIEKITCSSLDDTELSKLAGLPLLIRLTYSNRQQSPNLHLLKKYLPGLKFLTIANVKGRIDLSPLAALTQLEGLDLQDLHTVDLTPLASLTNLKSLDLGKTQAVDLSPLASLNKLERLVLSHASNVSDLKPLAGLKQLRELELSGTRKVKDLSPLAGLTRLHSLNLFMSGPSDATALARLTALKNLHISSTRIADITPLAGLMNLETLSVGFQFATLDVKPLSGLKKLRHLSISRASVTGLRSLARLKNLETLDITGCFIKSLKQLRYLKNIKSLRMSGLSPEPSPRQVKSLRKALPQCTIKTRL